MTHDHSRWTVKAIVERLRVDERKAGRIIGLVTGTIDPNQYASVQRWRRRRQHEPKRIEKVMEALNEELDGFGVESIPGRWVNGYYGDIQCTYVNLGDSYGATFVLDHVDGVLRLTSYGDHIEAHPERFSG